jgi:hypothetical protein
MDLPRDGIELNTNIKSPDLSQVQRKEIEKECSIPLRIDGNHLPAYIVHRRAKNVLEVRRLSAKTGPIINDLALNFVFAEINERHSCFFSPS